ncbi:UBN1 [Bugula neritina]|uniref:UBN1 n=1 Tax=Bugula neritina TaxID=10212 RepID=A0A7J7J2Q0_BUGNE|nr:UBN1 [Bugula neritina]
METQRRVELKNFEKPKENDTKPAKLAVRFEIRLEESTDEKCPEISYANLLLKHELKRKRASSSSNSKLSRSPTWNSESLFPDENDGNMEAIAKQMEEKYGKAYVGCGRGKNVDLGDGYDTDDSFIDNDEAYDELVPSSLTTKHGGFYINTGKLDFKEVSDDEIVSDQEVKQTKKKRKLGILANSSSEADEDRPPVKPKKKRKTLSGDTVAKKALLSAKKRKKMLAPKAGLDNQRLKKKLLHKNKLMVKAKQNSSEKSNQYDSTINDVLKSKTAQTKKPASSSHSKVLPTTNQSQSATSVPTGDTLRSKDAKTDPVKLPDNLSENCLKLINSLKEVASKCTDEKSKFFTPEINNQLISLDNEVRHIPSIGTRNSVYSHLSSFLPINRETLMKRMKLLRQKELTNNLQEPIEQLKAAINEVMPAQIEKYNLEVQQRQASKLEDVEKQKEDTQDSDDDGPSTVPPSTSTSFNADSQAATTDDKKKEKPVSTFRKKFEWTDKIRSCLCAVVAIKMESLSVLKAKGLSNEEFVKEFLENEVRILWPKGWMQSRVLYKESKSAHIKWTNPSQPPPSKPVIVKKPPLISNAIKMAASISSNTKKSPAPPGSKAGQSLLDKATVDTTAKLAISTVQENDKADAKTGSGILKNIYKSANKPVTKPLAKLVSSPTSKLTTKPTVTVKVTNKSSDANISQLSSPQPQSAGSSSSQPLLHTKSMQDSPTHSRPISAVVKTTEAGEKVIMDGTKMIGRLVTNTPKVIATSSPIRKDSHSVTSKPSANIKVDIVRSSSNSGTSSSSHSGSVTDIKQITLQDSPNCKQTLPAVSLPVGSASPTVKQRRPNIAKQQKIVAQSQQAAATAVMQTAQALHQQHLAASLANQEAMLHHKKVAEDLANQQKLAKQQQIAAIAAEQNAASHLATQKRLMQQQVIAEQQQQHNIAARQKIVQMQQQQQTIAKLKQQHQQQANQLALAQHQQKVTQVQHQIQQQKLAAQVLQQQSAQQQKNMVQSSPSQPKIVMQSAHKKLSQQLAAQQQTMAQVAKQQLTAQQQQHLLQTQQQQQKLAAVKAQQQKELNARQHRVGSQLVSQNSPLMSSPYSSTSATVSPVTAGLSQPRSRSPVAATAIVSTPTSRIPPGVFPYAVNSHLSPVSPTITSGSALWPRSPLQQQQQPRASQIAAAEYRRTMEARKQLEKMQK